MRLRVSVKGSHVVDVSTGKVIAVLQGVPGLPTPSAGSLGIEAHDTAEMVHKIEQGFDYGCVNAFVDATGLSVKKVAELTHIAPRTLTRRQAERRFTPEESERLLRISRVFDQAVDLFEGDVDRARAWLERPQPALGGRVPLEFASTEVGAREVEMLIGRLEHGVFA